MGCIQRDIEEPHIVQRDCDRLRTGRHRSADFGPLTTASASPRAPPCRCGPGPNAGVTVVWNGGNTVVAHRGTGFAALFKKTLLLHNPRVTTIRGSSIDQLSFAAILAHSQGTPGIVYQDVGPAILDIPTEAVALRPNLCRCRHWFDPRGRRHLRADGLTVTYPRIRRKHSRATDRFLQHNIATLAYQYPRIT